MTTPPFIPPASQLRAITEAYCQQMSASGPHNALRELGLLMIHEATTGFSNIAARPCRLPSGVVMHWRPSDSEIAALQAAGYRVHVVEGRVLRIDW